MTVARSARRVPEINSRATSSTSRRRVLSYASMAEVSKSHAVFLGFCNDALERLRDDHSFEAGKLRTRIEGLVKELESWTTMKEHPANKEATIAAVLDSYREVRSLKSE